MHTCTTRRVTAGATRSHSPVVPAAKIPNHTTGSSAPVLAPAVPLSTTPPAQPLAARLARPIDVDFRRAPLQEVCEFLAREIDASVEFDGEALKQAAYTKNMPQTILLKQSSVSSIFSQLLKPYENMVIVADEARNTLLVTTKAAAANQSLTPLTLEP